MEENKQNYDDFNMLINECVGCIHKNSCGHDDFWMDELDLTDEERFIAHCVGCCCGNGCECNKGNGCSNYEDGTEPVLG